MHLPLLPIGLAGERTGGVRTCTRDAGCRGPASGNESPGPLRTRRWVDAVNADGRYGMWDFVMVRKVGDVIAALDAASKVLSAIA
jgi:hypothetical protein